MGAQFLVQIGGKRARDASGAIGFDILEFAHAGNGGTDVGIIQDEAQRDLRHGVAGGDHRP